MLINQDLQWNNVGSEDQMFPDIESLDSDSPLFPDDLFQALSSELGIPLLQDGDVSTTCENIKDETINDITSDIQLCNNFNILQPPTSMKEDYITDNVKNEIEFEPEIPNVKLNLSSKANYSESSTEVRCEEGILTEQSPIDVKLALETPPISPPQHIPQSISPQPIRNVPFVQQLKIIPLNDTKRMKYVLATGNTAKRICIQPKEQICVTKCKEQLQKTIVLSAQDFAAFSQKIKQNDETRIRNGHGSPVNNIKENSIDICSVHIDSEGRPVQFLPENHVKIFNTIPNVHLPGNDSIINSPSTPLILKNDNVSPSIVLKKESITCTPIFLEHSNPNYSSVIIKNENSDIANVSGRQECEINALKRQQRMIKNRESACLSRRKKKEYVTSLEKQISELQEENKHLKSENITLKQALSALEDVTGTSKKFRTLNLTTNGRNAAFLLGIFFMISLNMNGIGYMFSDHKKMTTTSRISSTSPPIVRHGRTLLWRNSASTIEQPFEENFNRTLHHPMCPMYINQSESIRLDYELRRWIGGESHKDNWTTTLKTKLELKSLGKLVVPKSTVKGNLSDSKVNVQKNEFEHAQKANNVSAPNTNAIEVFSPKLHEHASLFEALGRRDDTFYVVWFSGEHLLLPASRKNSTTRPRMSLVLPAVPMNETFSTPANHITMMQIDCEVTNTQLLHLQQSVIPNHLRNNKSGAHDGQTDESDDISGTTAETLNITRSYRPYFMRENVQNPDQRKNIQKNSEDPYHQKEAVHILKDKFLPGTNFENIKSFAYDVKKDGLAKSSFFKRSRNIHNP